MAKNTIMIKKYSNVIEEFVCSAAITPGMLVAVASTGKIAKHADGLAKVLPMFAIEDALQGKGINDDYAAGDQVRCWIPYRGDIVNCLLSDEENIAIGDKLVSTGDGKVKKVTEDSDRGFDFVIGIAVEAVDLSSYPDGSESSAGGDYYNPRIQVRIL